MNKQQDNPRFIPNSLQPFNKDQSNIEKLRQTCLLLLVKNTIRFYSSVNPGEIKAVSSKKSKSYNSFCTFDGAGSYLIAYVKLFQFFKQISLEDLQFLKQNISADSHQYFDPLKYENDIRVQIRNLESLILSAPQKRPEFTFFFSPVGVYLVEMIYFAEINDQKSLIQNIQKILAFQNVVKSQEELYHEVLYGTSGYLYCLLYANKYFTKYFTDEINGEIKESISQMFKMAVTAGLGLKEDSPEYRLVYEFHNTEYLGAAHGLLGVCQMQMHSIIQNPEVQILGGKNYAELVQKSLKFCSSLQHPSGNFPSAKYKEEADTLVQFCHGSPGAVAPLILGHQIFEDNAFKEQAIKAGENIWKFGILTKGFGLCHGITGNAYPFLSLYRFTSDIKWLYYALSFVSLQDDKKILEIISNTDLGDRYVVGVPDYPFSYMMGITGDICFMADCLYPESSLFLGYEL